MRWAVLIFGGSLFSLAAVAMACSSPGSVTGSSGSTSAGTGGASGGGGTGGAVDIDGVQECIDYCTTSWDKCAWGEPDFCILEYCQKLPTNMSPNCEGLYDEYYACMNHAVQTLPTEIFCTEGGNACSSLALYQCRDDYGCTVYSCWPDKSPNGTDACRCGATCQKREFDTLCWVDGTQQFCECRIDNIAVAVCEEPMEDACNFPRPAESCCNQYFMLPW